MAYQLKCSEPLLLLLPPVSLCCLISLLLLAGSHPTGSRPLLSQYQKPSFLLSIPLIIDRSLYSVFSKLLERHVHSLLSSHLNEQGLLSSSQWGFMPGKSTTTALTSTFHSILELAEKGYDMALLFFDLKKAFDTVPHLQLLETLMATI